MYIEIRDIIYTCIYSFLSLSLSLFVLARIMANRIDFVQARLTGGPLVFYWSCLNRSGCRGSWPCSSTTVECSAKYWAIWDSVANLNGKWWGGGKTK